MVNIKKPENKKSIPITGRITPAQSVARREVAEAMLAQGKTKDINLNAALAYCIEFTAKQLQLWGADQVIG